jgi:hypothetical protein
VHLPVDSEFLREVERFALCFTCPQCVHYVASRGVCGNAWPTAQHLRVPQAGEVVVFCKEFEVL